MPKPERKRVTKEQMRDNARAGASGNNFFRLPPGVGLWEPEKADTYEIDVLPYEISIENHPDNLDKGTIWYKMPFNVHKSVGPNDENLICPGSLNKKCPICEQVEDLKKDYDKNEKEIKALRSQRWVVMNIADPEDSEKVLLFAYSYGKFQKFLSKEVEQTDDKNVAFYDVNEDGKTLKVRFSKESFEGRPFLQASRIDFVDRKEIDEEETLNRTVNLDETLIILPYDKIKKLHEGADETEEETKPATTKVEKPAPKEESKAKPTASKAEKWEEGDKVIFARKGKTLIGKIKAVDDDNSEVTVVVGDDEFDIDFDDLAKLEAEKPKAGTKPDPKRDVPPTKIEEGDKVSGKNAKGKPVTGVVTEVDDDDITVKDADGKEHICDVDDLTKGSGTAKTEKKEVYKPAVGDWVTYPDEDGDSVEGEVVKIDAEGARAKIENEDGDKEWVPLDKISKK